MSRGKDLIKNTGILMIAKISTQIVSFLLLPLYTAYLSTAEYGQVDVYTSLAMIIVPFLTLQVEMGLFRFFIASNTRKIKKSIISSAICIIIICVAFSSVIYWGIVLFINLKYSCLLYYYYLTITISTVLLQVCRAMGDNIAYGLGSFISSVLSILLNIILVLGFQWKIEGIIFSTIIAQIISSIFMIIRTKVYKYISIKSIDLGECKRLLSYSVPLVFNQIASWAINYSDRLLILFFWGAGANGIYSIANKFSNIMNTFFGVYNVAWTENVVRSMDDEDSQRYISNIFETTFNIYLIIITGIINLLPFFFSVLINSEYADAYFHVPFLLISALFSGMSATIGSIYIAYNKTKVISITTCLAGILNIIIHLILLKQFKLYAASISTLVSFTALFIYRFIFVKKIVILQIKIKSIILRIFILLFGWFAYITKIPSIILVGFFLNLISILDLYKNNKEMIRRLLTKNTNK